MHKRTFLQTTLVAAATGWSTVRAQALPAGWPSRPIKFVVPYPAGGPIDNMVRHITTKVSADLGQPLVIDNRAGAGGAIGTAAVVQGEPTGYVFGVGVLGVLAIIPHIEKVPFKAETVNYVTLLTKSPHVLVVNAESPIRSLRDFVEAARNAPGKLNYGSTGTGGSTHLVGELFAREAKIDIMHIPYKGGAPMVNAILGGEIQLVPLEISAVFPLLDKLRVIAVLSEKRNPALPDVPTAVEQGYPRLVSNAVYGVIAPNGTPAAIVDRFRSATVAALNSPEVKERLAKQGQTVMPSTPAEYRNYMVGESARWSALIAERKIVVK